MKIVNNCFHRSDVSCCEQSERGLPCETMRHKSRRENAAECIEAEYATMFQEIKCRVQSVTILPYSCRFMVKGLHSSTILHSTNKRKEQEREEARD